MVKHKGASNNQAGAYKPPKRLAGVRKIKDKGSKKLKEVFIKKISQPNNNSVHNALKLKDIDKKYEGNKSKKMVKENFPSEEVEGDEFPQDIIEEDVGNKGVKKGKKKKSHKLKKNEEYSSEVVDDIGDEALRNKSAKKIKKKKFDKYSSEKVEEDDVSGEISEDEDGSIPLEGAEFAGDISEQDIDSDDDLSLNEDELPVPPDVTTSEEESSEDDRDEEEEQEEGVNEDESNENQIEKDSEELRTIFVGNLPKSVTKIQLKKWFSKYGTVESVRLRCAPIADPVIPKKLAVIKQSFHEERNNIHGFVKFSTSEEANGALAANGQPFDETHHIRVDIAGKIGQKKQYDDKKAIFIGNVPFNAEEDQLRDLFADCGDISCIRIVRDKHTAVGKGFAYINFASRHSVRLALEKHGIELNGRRLRIQKVLYNQEVESIPLSKLNKRINYRRNNDEDNKVSNIMKFKKKKKNKASEQFEFQGLSSKKDVKRKKMKKKKKKLKLQRETLKKVLNTEGNNKRQVTF
ncbi:hypothetical protein O3M35_012810 [Rhynocoris fuscipes]|uniref:RRM domain-containing protein n=1 Tax=Rhynocoris fuscipes TaxID=488301 RepID=A0AAW1CEJ2_9HEMI